MDSERPPDEITVLLKVLDIVELSMRNAAGRDLDPTERVKIFQVVNTISGGTVVGTVLGDPVLGDGAVMGDNYTVGQAGAVGPYSKAENMSFRQIWQQSESKTDLGQLAEELQTLRSQMRKQADSPAEDMAVAEIGQAHLAAKEGDGPRSLSHLKRAGEWALKVAVGIGTGVAAGAIKSAMGL